ANMRATDNAEPPLSDPFKFLDATSIDVLEVNVLQGLARVGYLFHRSVTDNFAVADHGKAVDQTLNHFENVRSEKDGNALPCHEHQKIFNAARNDGIDSFERFVQKQDPRVVNERHRQGTLLLHPERRLIDEGVPV